MKKRLLFITPAILAMLASACTVSTDSGDTSPSSSSQTSSEPSSSSSSTESAPSSSSTESTPSSSSSSQEPPAATKYTITFKDENGVTLESKQWNKGTTPSYDYSKTDTDEWDYTIDGWSLTQGGDPITIPAANADATYYALVSQVKKQYTITFNSNGGSEVASITEDYGTVVAKPANPTKAEKAFVGWTIDQVGGTSVSWPITLDKNYSLYANWNNYIDIKGYLADLITVRNHSPYSYIPETMRGTYSATQVTRSEVTYDFSSPVAVSDIKYGGFGEQWHMVLDNINESQRYYSVLAGAETLITGSVVLFNDFLDNNPGETADHTLDETTYTAKINYQDGILKYSLRYKTGFSIPFFGEVTPQIDMEYGILSGTKQVRINLTENNALKYVVTNNSYTFAIEYGIEAVSRKAYFSIQQDSLSGVIQGHIYEFVQYKDKDLVPACADFYIYNGYVTAVGNKASGIIGFNDYINELYLVSSGRMVGYEIREEKTVLGVSVRFNTLWFNMCHISGVNSVKYIDSDHAGSEDEVGFYLNGSSTEFATKNFGGATKKIASRRYDVEFRKQYFYAIEDDKLVDIEVEVPMMFIQEEKLSDFPADVAEQNNGMVVSVSLSSTYIFKIQSDYDELIDVFIDNKSNVSSADIVDFIGSAEVID